MKKEELYTVEEDFLLECNLHWYPCDIIKEAGGNYTWAENSIEAVSAGPAYCSHMIVPRELITEERQVNTVTNFRFKHVNRPNHWWFGSILVEKKFRKGRRTIVINRAASNWAYKRWKNCQIRYNPHYNEN